MGKIARLLTLLILPVALVGILSAMAMADAGTAATATGWWPLTWLTPYIPVLIPLLAGVQSVVVRGQTSATGFWHGYWGHALLVLFGALIGAGLHFLQAGAFTKQALVAALAGAGTAFFGAWKTQGKDTTGGLAESAAAMASGSGGVAKQGLMFLALLSVFMAVPGCSYCKVPANSTTPVCKVAEVSKVCGAPEVVKLVLQYLPDVVAALLSNNYSQLLGDLVTRLTALGVDGPTVVSCIVATADANATPPPGSAMLPHLATLHEHATAWQAAHPLAAK